MAERRGAALLIVDMIGDAALAGSKAMRRQAARAERVIAGLRDAARAGGVPVIFVNGAFARHPHTEPSVESLIQPAPDGLGLWPAMDDHVVVKAQFSGFYATRLPALLDRLDAGRLILTGIATDIGLLFTAADAHMRDYALWVPEDAVAGTSAARNRWALELIHQSLATETRPTTLLPLAAWLAEHREIGGVAQ